MEPYEVRSYRSLGEAFEDWRNPFAHDWLRWRAERNARLYEEQRPRQTRYTSATGVVVTPKT